MRWLLANHQTINWPKNDSLKYQWLSWRKGEAGVLASHELDFTGSAAFAPLQWGEIVECRITMSARGSGYSSSPGLPAEVVAALRNHIAFPITFEIDGKSRELTVRGDRVIFDPTKDELPWKNLQQLVELFWQTPVTLETWPTIQISRKDWPDVRLSFGSMEAEKFQLESGDRVKLEIPDKVREDMARARSLCVTLKVDGYPFTKYFGSIADGKPVAASIPTLIQMLADTQCPPNSGWKELMAIKTLEAGKLTELSYFFDGFTLCPHPDFSRIRIHRLKDGADYVLEVDLAKIIAASTGATLAEDARKADITLLSGDIVEISLIKERLGEPWKGLTAQEEAFFAKALSGRVRLTDGQGNINVRDLIFKSPRFIETGGGRIPMPPETGIPSVRGSWLTADKWMSVKRGEIESAPQRVTGIFLRDGDEISTSRQQQIPRQPAG